MKRRVPGYCISAALTLCFLVPYAQTSSRSELMNYKFTSLDLDPETDNYFIIKDSVHTEYSGGKLFARSKFEWTSPSTYNVILRWMTPDYKGPIPGDTLKIEIEALKQDTLTLLITNKNVCHVARYFRSNP